MGAQDAAADVEIISILALFFEKIGVKNLILNLNSIGCPECRKAYNELLKEYLSDKISDMCDTCKTRYDRNPMRILDCKVD